MKVLCSRKGAKDAKINRNISLRPLQLSEKTISQEVMVLAHEMLCSRKGAKDAKECAINAWIYTLKIKSFRF